MKKYINKFLFGSLLVLSVSCDNSLDQFPDNIATADSLTNYQGVLSAAYHYQQGGNTTMAVLGDFRSDNMEMKEAPYTDFEAFNSNLVSMEDQFFLPLYANMYKAILQANIVITNSDDAGQIAEAKFLRALSYFKLVQVFGDVSVNLSTAPLEEDSSNYARQSATNVYNNVIVPDLEDAIAGLGDSGYPSKATTIAANALLGKVYMFMNEPGNAESYLKDAIDGAASAGIELETNFDNVVLESSTEAIFTTLRTSTIADEYGFSEFTDWYGGTEDKALLPVDSDLIAAYDAEGDTVRKGSTLDDAATVNAGVKWSTEVAESDWVEIRLSDVILLYAEAQNENTSDTSMNILSLLDDIRTRAGLSSLSGTASSQDDVRDVILDERRLELAFEGHRWFDLVRTDTVDAEMGQTINSNYHIFPIPESEIIVLAGVISQNAGY